MGGCENGFCSLASGTKDKSFSKGVGVALTGVLLDAGWTIERLAEVTGVNEARIQAVMADQWELDEWSASRIEKAIGLPEGWLLNQRRSF